MEFTRIRRPPEIQAAFFCGCVGGSWLCWLSRWFAMMMEQESQPNGDVKPKARYWQNEAPADAENEEGVSQESRHGAGLVDGPEGEEGDHEHKRPAEHEPEYGQPVEVGLSHSSGPVEDDGY